MPVRLLTIQEQTLGAYSIVIGLSFASGEQRTGTDTVHELIVRAAFKLAFLRCNASSSERSY